MSRRTVAWKYKNILGKNPLETAENILSHNNRGVNVKIIKTNEGVFRTGSTVPMHNSTASRIANVLHRSKV